WKFISFFHRTFRAA
ncbi:RecBCD enzyme subunit RecC, partial [Haemophilus influenzae]